MWVWYFGYLCCLRILTGVEIVTLKGYGWSAELGCSLCISGFMGAMISNLAFVFSNIFSKKGMKGNSVSGMNYYACLSMLSLAILTPFAIAVEGTADVGSRMGKGLISNWTTVHLVIT